MPLPSTIATPDTRATVFAQAEATAAPWEPDFLPGLFMDLGVGYYTHHASRPAATQIIRISIDPMFASPDREKILDAVREWNHVLNGHVRIEPTAWDTPGATQLISASAPPPGDAIWTVHRSDRPFATTETRSVAVTLAMPLATPARATIVVFVERLRSVRIDRIMLHEFGHALGLPHDPRGHLMQETYAGNEQICVDRTAVEQVARLRGIPVNELNWCTY